MRKNLNLIALKIAASCEDMVLKNLKTRVLSRVDLCWFKFIQLTKLTYTRRVSFRCNTRLAALYFLKLKLINRFIKCDGQVT